MMQWRLDRWRSGSASTQSFSAPRPMLNSPPLSVRVSGATESGQRSTVRVSAIGYPISTVGRPNTITPPCAVMSPMRAAG